MLSQNANPGKKTENDKFFFDEAEEKRISLNKIIKLN